MLPSELAQQPQAPALKIIRLPEQSQPGAGEHPPRLPVPGEGWSPPADLCQSCPAVVRLPKPLSKLLSAQHQDTLGSIHRWPGLAGDARHLPAQHGGWLDPALASQPPGLAVFLPSKPELIPPPQPATTVLPLG